MPLLGRYTSRRPSTTKLTLWHHIPEDSTPDSTPTVKANARVLKAASDARRGLRVAVTLTTLAPFHALSPLGMFPAVALLPTKALSQYGLLFRRRSINTAWTAIPPQRWCCLACYRSRICTWRICTQFCSRLHAPQIAFGRGGWI